MAGRFDGSILADWFRRSRRSVDRHLRAARRITVSVALVPVTVAIAQAPAPPVTLRVNTQLVEVSVVVKDRHGNPVTDLKQGDFELYDNGKKQEIRVFQVEDHRPASQPPSAPATPRLTPPGTFTNRTPAEPGAPNAPTVLLIDAGNTWDKDRMTWQDLVYARDQVVKFLRQVRPEDRLGIYLMGTDRFWILHEYNRNCADLLARLASWTGTAAPGSVAAKLPDVWSEFAVHFAHVDDETAKAIHRSQFYTPGSMGSSALPEEATSLPKMHGGVASNDALGQEAPTPAVGTGHATPAQAEEGTYILAGRDHAIEVLAGVANHLASVPGRKNVILISGRMFLPAKFQDQLKVLRTIIHDGVAVYAVDPGGLAPYALDASFVIPSKATMFANDTKRAADAYIKQHYDAKQEIIMALQSSLRTLAESTGGQVFTNTNGIADAIRSSFDDSRVTYTLGFYPQTSGNDGAFHPVKVKLPNHEQLSVRYRTGYVEPAPPSRDAKQAEAELRQATWSPVDASAIELNGSVLPIAGANDYELKLNIGLAAVSLQPDGNRWSGQIEVALIQRDNSGNGYEPLVQTLGLMLRQDSYDNAVKGGFPYRRTFRPNPKATSLRVVVRDLNSGNIGTLTFPSPRGAE